jgi:hypothetical protein
MLECPIHSETKAIGVPFCRWREAKVCLRLCSAFADPGLTAAPLEMQAEDVARVEIPAVFVSEHRARQVLRIIPRACDLRRLRLDS